MKLMLDNSVKKIEAIEETYDIDLLQLRTPLTRYSSKEGRQYGMDNGAFTVNPIFNPKFWNMVKTCYYDHDCLWIVAPDKPGQWKHTLAQFNSFKERYPEKLAIAIQDGATVDQVPWDDIVCVFIGGTDDFKYSREARLIAYEAKNQGKWVHVGRVNTPKNIVRWFDVADSFDGSGIARFHVMLLEAITVLQTLEGTRQCLLEEF